MVIKTIYSNHLWPALLCLLLISTFSCSSKAEYAGLYKAQETESKKHHEIDLNENGEGVWRVEDNEDTFSWYVKGDEIRLNTKAGGVIVAKIQNGTLEIRLPGREKLSFRKVE